MTTLILKMEKIGVLGADKRSKTLAGHEFVNNLFKEEVRVNILSGEDNVLMEDGCHVSKRSKVL